MVDSPPPQENVIRGALRIDLGTSSPDVQAGQPFTLFVKISNPFDIPIEVKSVTAIMPVDFIDIGTRARATGSTPAPQLAPQIALASTGEQDFYKSLDVAEADIPVVAADRNPAGMFSVTLQANDSGTQGLTLRTTSWLLFTPATYSLPIHIDYRIGNTDHRETVECKLTVRAPFLAIASGAAIGAVAGLLLRDGIAHTVSNPFAQGWGPLFIGLLSFIGVTIGVMLGAVISLIAFARKRDAQPFITVEDFWGGVFIGAVVGYGGPTLLDRVLKAGT